MKTRKDLVFYSLLCVWLIVNLSVYFWTKCNDYIFYINNGFVVVMCILMLFKCWNAKFRDWLNKKL